MVTIVTFCKLESLIKKNKIYKLMSYYNNDINDTPAPGTGHTAKTDSFEEWKRKRDAKLAATGWSRTRLKQSARLIAHKRKELKDYNK